MSSQHAKVPTQCSPRCALDSLQPQDIGRKPRCSTTTGASVRRQYSSGRHNTHLQSFIPRSFHLTHNLSLILFLILSVVVVGAAARPERTRNIDLLIDRSAPPPRLVGRSAFAYPQGSDNIDDLPTQITRPDSRQTATPSSPSSQETESNSLNTTDDDDTEAPPKLPVPFDNAAISTNLTADCTNFLKTFLADKQFNDCLPLSFLLENSDSFFQTLKKGSFAITKAIEATCNVDVGICEETLSQFSAELTSANNCQSDYEAYNPLVRQAGNAFAAYKTVYSAGCLKSDDGSYCYVDASTSTEFSSDPLIYFLPLGVALPPDTSVRQYSCSSCMKKTLSIFSSTVTNSSSPLASTYSEAAKQINTKCGDDYAKVEMNLQTEDPSSAAFRGTVPTTVLLVAIVLVGAVVGV